MQEDNLCSPVCHLWDGTKYLRALMVVRCHRMAAFLFGIAVPRSYQTPRMVAALRGFAFLAARLLPPFLILLLVQQAYYF